MGKYALRSVFGLPRPGEVALDAIGSFSPVKKQCDNKCQIWPLNRNVIVGDFDCIWFIHQFGKKIFRLNMAGAQGVFLRTDRGNPKQCFWGYMYMKHRAHDYVVIWRWTRKRCRGRVVAASSGLVVEERMPHDNEASYARVNLTRVRGQMKDMAQSATLGIIEEDR